MFLLLFLFITNAMKQILVKRKEKLFTSFPTIYLYLTLIEPQNLWFKYLKENQNKGLVVAPPPVGLAKDHTLTICLHPPLGIIDKNYL